MLRSALVLFCIALAVQAKTRKGSLPNLFWDKVKHLDVVDVPEDKIIGGTEVTIYFTIWRKLQLFHIAEGVQLVIQHLEQKTPFCHFAQPYQITIIEQMALVIQNLLNHWIELGTYYLSQFKVKIHQLLEII